MTIPAFYLAPSEDNPDQFEVVDGQQRLTTLNAFYKGDFTLETDDRCPYFGKSVHYADRQYKKLDDAWRKAFRLYNLTLVILPQGMPLNLRLEIFRRINEGGTPLSAQDIRLSYYSESKSVRFVQLVGVYDTDRVGSARMVRDARTRFSFKWPWQDCPGADAWFKWWYEAKTASGQTASEMFLWYIASRCRTKIDKIIENESHLRSDCTFPDLV